MPTQLTSAASSLVRLTLMSVGTTPKARRRPTKLKESDPWVATFRDAANATKSALYASDWDEHPTSPQGRTEGFRTDGLPVRCYDVFSGATSTAVIPIAVLDSPDTFLRTGGSVQDRHTVPAAVLMSKISMILAQLRRMGRNCPHHPVADPRPH